MTAKLGSAHLIQTNKMPPISSVVVLPHRGLGLIGGGMIMTKEWEDTVPAIVYGWYSGMKGGTALSRILFGDVNPSGKLPFTIPQDQSHLPYFSNTDAEITYDLYHGYSYLDKNGHAPAYPFGFGLAYTTWEYGEPQLDKQDDHVMVTVDLKNAGDVAGGEVVQVYVGIKQSAIDRQKKLLKGFKKVYLEPGQSTTVSIPVDLDELRYFSNEQRKWVFEPGIYSFYVGSSSDEADLQVKEVELVQETFSTKLVRNGQGRVCQRSNVSIYLTEVWSTSVCNND